MSHTSTLITRSQTNCNPLQNKLVPTICLWTHCYCFAEIQGEIHKFLLIFTKSTTCVAPVSVTAYQGICVLQRMLRRSTRSRAAGARAVCGGGRRVRFPRVSQPTSVQLTCFMCCRPYKYTELYPQYLRPDTCPTSNRSLYVSRLNVCFV